MLSYTFFKQIIFVLSSLSLEIYIVQFSLITDKYNDYFPLSILIVTVFIVAMAYFLKLMTNIFVLIMSKGNINFRNILRL